MQQPGDLATYFQRAPNQRPRQQAMALRQCLLSEAWSRGRQRQYVPQSANRKKAAVSWRALQWRIAPSRPRLPLVLILDSQNEEDLRLHGALGRPWALLNVLLRLC